MNGFTKVNKFFVSFVFLIINYSSKFILVTDKGRDVSNITDSQNTP